MKNTASLLDSEGAGVCPLLAPAPGVAHGIVSQAVFTSPGLRLTLFHFAAGQELSEHTSAARAFVQVLSGACEFTFSGEEHALKAGDLVHLPPGLPHSVRAVGDLAMLLTQVSTAGAGK